MNNHNYESSYLQFRGKCEQYSIELVAKDPTLSLVRGFYYDPLTNTESQHWWCETSTGLVVDPTKLQFPSAGNGIYTKFTGLCKCEECGLEVSESTSISEGKFRLCSSECQRKFLGLSF